MCSKNSAKISQDQALTSISRKPQFLVDEWGVKVRGRNGKLDKILQALLRISHLISSTHASLLR